MKQTEGIYLISMVAESLNMHPQTLRKYERAGFIEPLRMGTLRTYSDEDVARLRLIKHFVEDLGLNLSGIELALSMTNQLLQLRAGLVRDSAARRGKSDSVRKVDQMLAGLGVLVKERSVGMAGSEPPVRREGSFTAIPGQSVEFSIPRIS